MTASEQTCPSSNQDHPQEASVKQQASDDAIKVTPRQAYDLLVGKGKQVPVSLHSDSSIADKPSWFDEARFAKAREAVQKFFIGVQFSSYTGLLLILQLPDGLEPLLSTGNSKDIPSLFRRYLNTVVYVKTWYDDDVFDSSTKGYKSIRNVRSMHKRVQKLMNEKFSVPDSAGRERIWMTHYDMSITQFAFIGLAMLYPEKCGMIAASRRELELINYYWRVLGHLMGIEDAYNSCQFDTYDDIVAYNRILLQESFLDVFEKEPCEKGLSMTKAITLGLKYYLPMITFNNLAHWWSDCFYFNGYQPQPQTRREKVLFAFMKFSMNKMMKSDRILLPLSSWAHRKSFDLKLKRREKVYEKLKTKYQDNKEYSYFSDKVNYFSNPKLCPQDEASAEFDNGIADNFVSFVTGHKTKLADSRKSACPFLMGQQLDNAQCAKVNEIKVAA